MVDVDKIDVAQDRKRLWGFCEHGNELPLSTKCCELLDEASNFCVFDACGYWSWLNRMYVYQWGWGVSCF